MFFYAAKILWTLLQPSMLILFAIVCGALLTLRPGWGRFGRGLVVLGVVGLIACGASPLSLAMARVLEDRFQRTDLARGAPIAGVIILGGSRTFSVPKEKELASLNDAAERLTEGAALAQRLPGVPIVFTGGDASLLTSAPTEAEEARRLLMALGIESRRIVLESRSRDTFENAQFTKALLHPEPGQRWLLVTSAWHMPRAMGCFRKAGFDVEPWPVDYRSMQPFTASFNVADGLRRTDIFVKEYVGLLSYWLRGRTDVLLPGP